MKILFTVIAAVLIVVLFGVVIVTIPIVFVDSVRRSFAD